MNRVGGKKEITDRSPSESDEFRYDERADPELIAIGEQTRTDNLPERREARKVSFPRGGEVSGVHSERHVDPRSSFLDPAHEVIAVDFA